MTSGYKSFGALKAEARGNLLGFYTLVVPVQLVFLMLSAWISGIGTLGEATPLRTLIFIAIAMICALLVGVLRYGLSRFYMNLCCHYPARMGDLFYGFRPGDNRPVLLSLIFLLIETVCFFPSVLAARAYLGREQRPVSLLVPALALLIIGALIYYLCWLSLSQSYYLLSDFPKKPLPEILRLSLWLMRGQRLRLFAIQLSFLPILLLCVLSLGLGMLWALPYINATLTCFHLDLTRAAAGESG